MRPRVTPLRMLVLAGLAVGVAVLIAGRDAQPGGASTKPAARPAAGSPGAALDVRDLEVAADHDPDPVGHLRLEGQVIDDAGAPVAGATVTIDVRPPRIAITGDDGSFAIDGLLATRYTLIARAGDAAGGPVKVQVSETADPVIITVRAAAIVRVRVVAAADRAPIAGAAVELRSFETRQTQTDGEGIARFTGVLPWRYTVAASAPGYGPAYELIAVASAGQELPLELALSPGVRVAGHVVDDAGAPIAAAHVDFERTTDAQSDRPNAGRDGVATDASGAFAFPALAAGSYRFVAGDDVHAQGAAGPIVVDGVHAIDDVRIVLSAGAAIAGRVVHPDGTPAAGAVVRIAPKENASRPAPRQVAAGADGAFRMAGLPRQAVYVVAFGGDASSETLELDLAAMPERADVVITLGITGVIAGVVVDAAGEPVESAQVAAFPQLGAEVVETARLRTTATAATDGAGGFRLAGLPDGTYTLRAYRDGVPPSADWVPTGTRARTGDTNVRLVLPGDGTIVGEVAFPDGSAPAMYLVRIGTRPPIPLGDPDGAVRVPGVPAGRTSVTVSGPSFETTVIKDVNVEADEETDVGTITVRKGRSITGRVLTASGEPVPGAKVFCGKRVVGSGTAVTMQNWGAPGSSGATRSAETDAQGGYAIRGLAPIESVVIADHPTIGRSATVQVPAQGDSLQIDLVLTSPGAIEGTITRGGQPVPRYQVTAAPHPIANNASFVVKTDADGRYRFERLVPGDYLVTATGGMHPIAGVTQTGQLVAVVASETARFDVDLPEVTVDVVVNLHDEAGEPVRMAEVHLVGGTLQATVAHQVHAAEAQLAGGFTAFNIIADGRPAKIRRVPPGDYTLCSVPYPDALAGLDPGETAAYIDNHARDLPAYCRALAIAAAPAEQAVTVDVRLPSMPGT
jgi:protocatechuate 3,4-dioxygenase beta subunit